MTLRKNTKRWGTKVFSRPSKTRVRCSNRFQGQEPEKNNFQVKKLARYVASAIQYTMAVAILGFCSSKILPISPTYQTPMTSATCSQNSPIPLPPVPVKKVVRKPVLKLQKSGLGPGFFGLIAPDGTLIKETTNLRNLIRYPSGTNVDPNPGFRLSASAIDHKDLTSKVFSSYKPNDRSMDLSLQSTNSAQQNVDFLNRLFRKEEVLREHMNLVQTICFNWDLQHNQFFILSPKVNFLQSQVNSFSERLRTGTVLQVLPELITLNSQCENLLKDILVVRYEVSMVRLFKSGTFDHRVVNLPPENIRSNLNITNSEMFNLSYLVEPQNLEVSETDKKDYLLLFEDVLQSASTHFYMGVANDGSAYQNTPFYVEHDFVQASEESVSRSESVYEALEMIKPEDETLINLFQNSAPIFELPAAGLESENAIPVLPQAVVAEESFGSDGTEAGELPEIPLVPAEPSGQVTALGFQIAGVTLAPQNDVNPLQIEGRSDSPNPSERVSLDAGAGRAGSESPVAGRDKKKQNTMVSPKSRKKIEMASSAAQAEIPRRGDRQRRLALPVSEKQLALPAPEEPRQL